MREQEPVRIGDQSDVRVAAAGDVLQHYSVPVHWKCAPGVRHRATTRGICGELVDGAASSLGRVVSCRVVSFCSVNHYVLFLCLVIVLRDLCFSLFCLIFLYCCRGKNPH